MTSNWKLVHSARWYTWLPLTIYGSIVEIFMGLMGVSGTVFGLGYLLGLIPRQTTYGSRPISTLETLATFLLEIAFSIFFAWSGITGALAALLDIFAPAQTIQDALESISTESRPTKNGSYQVFCLATQGGWWEIPLRDISDRFAFQRQVTAGRQIELTYRRGTRLVTRLAVQPRH